MLGDCSVHLRFVAQSRRIRLGVSFDTIIESKCGMAIIINKVIPEGSLKRRKQRVFEALGKSTH